MKGFVGLLVLCLVSAVMAEKPDQLLQNILEGVNKEILDRLEPLVGYRPADIEATNYEVEKVLRGQSFEVDIQIRDLAHPNGPPIQVRADILLREPEKKVDLEKIELV